MSTQIQYRRGTTSQSDSFTGALGEITVETTNKTLRVHDGITLGGFPLATQANLTITLDKTNAAFDKANAANILAQGAFDSANNVAPQIAPAFNQANAAFNQANTGTTIATGSFNQANAAFNQANTGTTIATGSFNQANAAFNQANGTAGVANTDVTNISTTGAHHGSASSVSAFRVEANGRISSANSTAIAIAASQITSGTLTITRGGTNATSYTTGSLLTSNGTAIVSLANTGTAGTYANASHVPVITTDAYGRVSAVTNTSIAIAASQVTSGTLAIARGGTNGTSFTTGNLIVFNGTSLTSIANSGVTAATYGDAANGVSITVDAYGRVTAASNVAGGGGGTDFAFYMGSI